MKITKIPLTNIYYFDIMLVKEYETFTNSIIMSKSARESMLVPYKYLVVFCVGGNMQEVWKDVKDYEGLYQVSNLGGVRRIYKTKPTRILKPIVDKDGYFRVSLSKCSERKQALVHRLVAVAFINNLCNYPVVNHKDENKQNNRMDNLEWCTILYNTRYNNAHLRKEKMRKPILQLTLDGKVVKEWSGRSEIEKTFGCNCGDITACCRHYYGRKTAFGFRWEYKGGLLNGKKHNANG